MIALLPALLVWLTLAQPLAAQKLNLSHIHGLGYLSAPGEQLLVGTHFGLALHDGLAPQGGTAWSLLPAPTHDYMGLAVADSVIYGSGHPARGSDLPNPLGLIASRDGGKTFALASLRGEADFHVLAVGRRSGAVYALVHAPNSAMPGPGLYRSTNSGSSWEGVSTEGVNDPRAVAVHPDNPDIIALAGEDGLYTLRLSANGGRVYRRVAEAESPRMVAYANDGKSVWYGGFAGRPYLMHLELPDGKPRALPLPELGRTTLQYLSQHPRQPGTLAVATLNRSILVSHDSGTTWSMIAENGQPR